MELMLLFPWLLGAALLVNLFDNDDEDNSTDIVSPTPPEDPSIDNPTNLTNGNDNYSGTSNDDFVSGGNGDDIMNGGAGDDVLFGRNGADTLNGGLGQDILIGGPGADTATGGGGDDYLIGNTGADGLFGNAGDDILFGGFGSDIMFGAGGSDTVVGDNGTDFVRGGSGDDIVSGNALYAQAFDGKDAFEMINNDAVNDISDLDGFGSIQQIDDLQADTVYGDAGNDVVYLGHKDIGFGGAGEDAFVISTASGATAGNAAQIGDFVAADDQIVLQYTGTAPAITFGDDGSGNATILADGNVMATVTGQAGNMSGANIVLQAEDGTQTNVVTPPPGHPFDNPTELTTGNDTAEGTPGVDVIEAKAGDDQVIGRQENDALFGQEGNDSLYGTGGDDVVSGGTGNDLLSGGTGNDFLIGNQGSDRMFGNQGDDAMYGGFNADDMYGSAGDDGISGDRGTDFIRGGSGNDYLTGNSVFNGFPSAKTAFDVRAGTISIAEAAQQLPLAHVDDLQADVVYGDAGNDTLLLGDKDVGFGGADQDTFVISAQAGTTTAADIQDFVSVDDQIVVEYTGDTAPTITISDDGNGNATVLSNGTVVAVVKDQAGNVTAADVTVQAT